MYRILPEHLKILAGECPYPLYVVGGGVRDFLAGLESRDSDTDICAPADPTDFARRAERAGFTVQSEYKNTGTVKIAYGRESYEFASFRSDEYVRGCHSPVRTFFTDDINLDARRRDFKCNAVYYDIKNRVFADPLGGVGDIERRKLSTVAEPEKVFGEDGLRLMRLARIAAQTGFTPEQNCLKGAAANAILIRDVSPERIFAELNLILQADGKYGVRNGQYAGLEILDKTRVLDFILPELAAGRGMEQNKAFHRFDVLEHSLRCAACADPKVRLAALLHDAGKPYAMNTSGSFIGHETEGARIVADILGRLKAPKKVIAETAELVRLHMYDFRGDAKENKVRKFILKNINLFDKLMLLKQADYSALAGETGKSFIVEKFERIYRQMQKEGVPFSLKELNIKGGDLIAAGFAPEKVGQVLESLQADCALKSVVNERGELLKRAVKVYLTM